MEFKPLKLLNLIYFILCLLATIFLSVYSILRYLKNEDAIIVKTSTFLASNDAIYPSFTLCIQPPFLDEKFDIYRNDSINATMYRGFLEGKYWHERFLKVDYAYVTANLSENLIDSFYRTHMNKFIHWTPDHYVSFRTSYRKCFTINAPASEKHPIRYTNLKIKNKIFPNGVRSSENRILTYIHYPGQRLATSFTQKNDFTPRSNKNINYRMMFRVRNMDVIMRRNKIHEPCLENWKHFDQSFMETMINEIGCRPPYWKISPNMPICEETEEMKTFYFPFSRRSLSSFMPPCRVIDRLDYTYREENLNDHDKSLRNRPRYKLTTTL